MTAPTRTSRGGGVLVAALTIDSVGNGLFLPLSLVFFTKLTDVSLPLVGLLVSIANLVTLPVPVWAGALADRFGPLPLVVGAQALQAVGFFAYSAVDGPVGIFVAATLVAIGVRFFWSAIFTAIADFADGTPGGRSHDSWYAIANMTRTAGLGVGGLVTGAAIASGSTTTYRAIAYAAAGCFAVAAVLIKLSVRAPHHRDAESADRGGYATLLRDRPFLALTGVNTIFAMSSMMLALALPTVMLEDLHGPAWLTSAVLVGNSILIAALAAPVVSRLRGYRRTRVIAASAALWALWALTLAPLGRGHLAVTVPILVGGTLLFTSPRSCTRRCPWRSPRRLHRSPTAAVTWRRSSTRSPSRASSRRRSSPACSGWRPGCRG